MQPHDADPPRPGPPGRGNPAPPIPASSSRFGCGAGAAPVKILLVDDEARNLDVLESLLQSPDHLLVRALTADRALMLLLETDFAAIVLDVQMPEISGIELASLIKQRKRTQHIPIIFLTAHFLDEKDVLVGYGHGAVDYLTKPINPQILRSKIAVFVDLFRKTRALAASNEALEREIAQRLRAEESLRSANNELEARVKSRTSELSRANEELRTREAALRASESMFKAASHAKDDFLAALSHELRTPLNPVLLLASHAAGDPSLPRAVKAQFDSIRRNVELEARLIDDLLDLTRITRGILRLEPRTLDVHSVLRDALSIVRLEAEEKRLEFVLDLAAPEYTVFGDAVRIQQVFWNLLKNAVKFTPPGGCITLESRTMPEEGELRVSVSDTGIGLSSDELERIFEAFAQGDHARGPESHRFGGLGLGLAISRTLVEMHSGRIAATSSGRNRGSAFLVTLPLLRAKAAPGDDTVDAAKGDGTARRSPHRPPGPARQSGRSVRILLVEDHAPTRSTLAHLLGCYEYVVTAAESAAQARAAAARQQFDLIISDIGLPDGEGCGLLKELRGFQPDLPGIALSGYGMDEDIARSRLAGYVEHMIKPVRIEALNNAIQAVVGAEPSGGETPG